MVTTATTARSTMVKQNKRSERMQVRGNTCGIPLSEPIYVQPQKGSWPFPVSSNSHSASHNAPSRSRLAKRQYMDSAGISMLDHLRALDVLILRRTACHSKGIGVAARRFCDNDTKQCGARIGWGGPAAEDGCFITLGLSAWRTPIPRPAYSTLGRAGGCECHCGLFEVDCCPLERIGD